eukprot:Nitzschia sp. Nitz4//scaffold11_size288233//274391//276061//NITZ4_000824-RA/size288233-processed-gene-0.256-mRNA-1//-1//CDS//3329534224//3665//frame0
MESKSKRAPPQLVFDDGSRIMTEEPDGAVVSPEVQASVRGELSLEEFYELDRIVTELVQEHEKLGDTSEQMYRVAVQFPDEMLHDSLDVCWLLEEGLSKELPSATPFVFCLGDTTVSSCCPDEVAALHLQAHVLVHYGHACLSPTGTLPVVYSFGRSSMNVDQAVDTCLTEMQPEKVLLLYQVGYHHVISTFREKLVERSSATVVVGKIPEPTQKKARVLRQLNSQGCGCGNDVCLHAEDQEDEEEIVEEPDTSNDNDLDIRTPKSLVVGGLALPESVSSWEELSEYTILFVGEFESTSQRQYVNIMLRFLSLPSPSQSIWTYSPQTDSLSSAVPRNLQKQLNRRFFLTQKARDAHVFGILVSNLSQQHLVEVVKTLQRKIQNAGKASYSFAVGKINPAKLANFAEIECFVLVACREHSLLSDEREYPVPVITPLELDVALGNLEWGGQAYSLDCQDILIRGDDKRAESTGDDDEEDDAPYYSLVSGKYVQKSSKNAEPLDLEHLPGGGKVTAYRSEAASFLKQREYQGLESLSGQTEAKAAVSGQTGIASNYGGS